MDIIALFGSCGASNTYVIINNGQSAVIDPSAPLNDILNAAHGSQIKYILLTHGHFDHFLTLEELRSCTNAPVCIHQSDSDFLTNGHLNASAFFLNATYTASNADILFSDRDTLKIGNEYITVCSTPGHTEGSVCFELTDALICGDTLFDFGYGRYDLPSGDSHKLAQSLKALADKKNDPMIYPGHGSVCRLSQAEYISYLRKDHRNN